MSFIASFLNLGAIFGAILAGPFVAKYGRRSTMIYADILGIIGLILTVIATLPTILIGRLVSGFVGGVNTVVVPMYLVEMSPLALCGATGSLSIIVLEISAFVSLAVSFAVPDAPTGGISNQVWRILFLVPVVLNVIRMLLLLFVFRCDTPYYYISKNHPEKAQNSLMKTFKGNVDKEYERVQGDVKASTFEGSVRFRDLFTKTYRRSLLISFLLALLQQFCGMAAIFVFSNLIFSASTSDTALYSTILGVVNLAAVIMSFLFIERYGRKPLIIFGSTLMGLILLAFSVIVLVNGPSHPSLKFLLIIWPIFFQISVGSLTFLYISETLPSVGVAVCVAGNWTAGFIVIQFYLHVVDAYGVAAPFLFFAIFCLFCAVVFAKEMVETKGRTKREIIAKYMRVEVNEAIQNVEEEIKKTTDVRQLNFEMISSEDVKTDEILEK